MPESVCEFLAPALTEYRLDIVLGEGANARTICLALKKFTLIGTTSRPSRVNRKLVPWLAVYDFKPYTEDQFPEVIRAKAVRAGLDLPAESVPLIVACCQGSLSAATVVIKKIRAYCGGEVKEQLTPETTRRILSWFGYVPGRTNSLTLADKLCSMTGSEFEEFVAQVFRSQGYFVEFTRASGDHGIDLVMHKQGKRAVVQCKRWDSSVGEPVIRDFYGAMLNSGVEVGYVVTSGYFTAQAVAFVADKPITLMDLDSLIAITQSNTR